MGTHCFMWLAEFGGQTPYSYRTTKRSPYTIMSKLLMIPWVSVTQTQCWLILWGEPSLCAGIQQQALWPLSFLPLLLWHAFHTMARAMCQQNHSYLPLVHHLPVPLLSKINCGPIYAHQGCYSTSRGWHCSLHIHRDNKLDLRLPYLNKTRHTVNVSKG